MFENENTKTINKALSRYRENPKDVDNIIWLGRRTAYLGRLRILPNIWYSKIMKKLVTNMNKSGWNKLAKEKGAIINAKPYRNE